MVAPGTVTLFEEHEQGLHEEGVPKLTRRQAQVLLLIRQGKGNADIAAELGISISVVKKHVTALLGAFGFRRRYELVVPLARSRYALVVPLARSRYAAE